MGSTGASTGRGSASGGTQALTRPMTAAERNNFNMFTGANLKEGARIGVNVQNTKATRANSVNPSRNAARQARANARLTTEARARGAANRAAAANRPQPTTGAVSREEFIRATGVDPRTGRRVSRRRK